MPKIRPLSALGLASALVLLFAQATSPAEPADPVVLAAGDIADCNATADSSTADLLDALAGTVLTLGDNAYENGSAQEYADCYHPTWGRHKARTLPSPGNHDYHTPGAAGYFGYFGSAAGPFNRGYYSFDLDTWHVVSLNSESGTSSTGAQVSWLKADLAATNADCVLAYWHQPRWTRGNYTDLTAAQHLWNALYDAGADVVLAGHDHNYQRYPPLNKSGALDPERGIRSFVVGTGGRHLYSLGFDPRREAGDDDSWGVLELTLRAGGYSWRFVAAAGSTYSDAGSGTCSSSTPSPSPPPPTPPPPTPPPPTPPPPSPPAPTPPPPSPSPASPPPSPPPTPTQPPTALQPTSPPPAPPPAPGQVPPPHVARPPQLSSAPRPVRIGGPMRVSASGRGRIWLACPKGGPDCAGRMTLTVPPRKGRTAIGTGRFKIRAASARPVTLELNAQAFRRLVRRGGLRGDLVAAAADGRPGASKPVRLVLVRARRS